MQLGLWQPSLWRIPTDPHVKSCQTVLFRYSNVAAALSPPPTPSCCPALHQVEPLALSLLTALASSSPQQRHQLVTAGGLPRALASAAMSAVNRSAGAREVQQGLCQLMLVLAGDSSAAADADLALWVRPLLFLAADAAAAGDLGLADVAMQSFVRCAGYGGTAVRGALRDLHVLPTLECLARSSDLSLRARAMAAVGPLVKVGLLESERDKATWRDRALGWLVATGGLEQELSERARQASEQQQSGLTSTLLGYLGLRSAAEARSGGDAASVVAAAAAAAAAAVAPEHRVELPAAALEPGSSLWGELQALRRACVSALKALSREEGVAGLQVRGRASLWFTPAECEVTAACFFSMSLRPPCNRASLDTVRCTLVFPCLIPLFPLAPSPAAPSCVPPARWVTCGWPRCWPCWHHG
jgi:hypothetical protein